MGTSDLNSAYFSLFFLIREVYYGWRLRYFHSSGASFVFLFLFLHLGRAMFYGSYFYFVNTWFSGILLLFFLMGIAFIGYVFPFVLPFLLLGFLLLHLFYLHFLSSSNPLRNSTNNKIPFFPFIFIKDFFGFILILCLYFLQTHFGISSFSHPDNALEFCGLLTPLHIVPEWYFLCQYAMLKAVPNKNAGFIILLTSIFILFFLGEIRRVSAYKKVMSSTSQNKNTSLFFGIFVCFVVIGAQFPQEIFLSY